MSDQAAEILQAFEALHPSDKEAVALEILRRTRELPLDSGPISEEEVGQASRAFFTWLDQEENGTQTR